MVHLKVNKESNNFIQIMKRLHLFSDFIVLSFHNQGLKITDINDKNNLCYDLDIKEKYFDYYKLTNDNSPELISISIFNLYKIFKLLNGIYNLEIHTQDNNKLKVIYQSTNKINNYLIDIIYLDKDHLKSNLILLNIKSKVSSYYQTIKITEENAKLIQAKFQEFNNLIFRINYNKETLYISSSQDDFCIEFILPIIKVNNNMESEEVSFTISYQLLIKSLKFIKYFSDVSLIVYSNSYLKIKYESLETSLDIFIH